MLDISARTALRDSAHPLEASLAPAGCRAARGHAAYRNQCLIFKHGTIVTEVVDDLWRRVSSYLDRGWREHFALARALNAQGKTTESREQAQEAAGQLEKVVGPDHADTRVAREISCATPPS